MEHINYIQIHPTTLYTTKPGRSFLISESVRGEGAYLYNKDGERFVNELLPRDVVSQAICKQMEKDGRPYVELSVTHLDPDFVRQPLPEHLSSVFGGRLRHDQGADSGYTWPALFHGRHQGKFGQRDLDGTACMQPVKPAATAYTAETVWQAIPCWRAWCLQNVQPITLQRR